MTELGAGHTITFSHPVVDTMTVNGSQLGPLNIRTGANQIKWSYGLHTQSYPTYAGEVVQILSAYTDNLTIGGEVISYAAMERIYSWFLAYIGIATQGKKASDLTSGITSYNEDAVTMTYPHRGWKLKIKPLNLPALRYGREVVIPQWTMEAAVVEEEAEMVKLSQEAAMLGDFKQLDASIGFRQHNPFSDPLYQPQDITKYLAGGEPITQQSLNDWFNSLIPAYTAGDVSGLTGPEKLASKPATPNDGSSTNTSG